MVRLLEEMVLTLETAGKVEDLKMGFLYHKIIGKLPGIMLNKWERKHDKMLANNEQIPDVKMLIGWLSIEANYLRRTQEILGVKDEDKNLNSRKSYFTDHQQKGKDDRYENKKPHSLLHSQQIDNNSAESEFKNDNTTDQKGYLEDDCRRTNYLRAFFAEVDNPDTTNGKMDQMESVVEEELETRTMEHLTEINEEHEERIQLEEQKILDHEQTRKITEEYLESEIKKVYEEILTNDTENGDLAEVSEQEKMETKEMLPHFPVVERKIVSTKVYTESDVADKQNGVPLNDRILSEPELQEDVADILTITRRNYDNMKKMARRDTRDSRGWNFRLNDRRRSRTQQLVKKMKNRSERWKKWKRWKGDDDQGDDKTRQGAQERNHRVLSIEEC